MPRANARGFARAIDSRQRAVHKIHVKFDGTLAGPAIVPELGKEEVTINKTGAGDYTVDLKIPAQRLLHVSGTGESDDIVVSCLSTSTAASIDLKVRDANAGLDADDVIYCEITVSDASDET